MTFDGRPSRDHILIDSAALWALRSTCSRAQVGVVIASSDYRPLVSGYNGAPAGMKHCQHICTCGRDEQKRRTITQMYFPGETPSMWVDPGHADNCLGQKPCEISVHAEANAIAYAARYGAPIEGGQLFTTVAPCWNCSMLIISAGITRVVFANEHRDMSGVDLLDKVSVEVVKYGHGQQEAR